MSEPTREMRDRAVAIARDILVQLHAENTYRIDTGNYFIPDADAYYDGKLDGIELRDCLGTMVPGCRVCMLGAAIVSKAKLFGGVKVSPGFGRGENLRELLSDAFDEPTVGEIEMAFECRIVDHATYTDRNRLAVRFGRKYKTPVERAEAIAKNIIDNDGLFVTQGVTSGGTGLI